MSILGDITDTLETTIVANTTLNDLRQGLAGQQTGNHPYGVITYARDFVSTEGLSGTVDSHIQTTIFVFGEDWEQTQTAIEELIILFMTTGGSLDDLSAANSAVIDFHMQGYVPARMSESDVATLSKFTGQVTYDLHIRYTYT